MRRPAAGATTSAPVFCAAATASFSLRGADGTASATWMIRAPEAVAALIPSASAPGVVVPPLSVARTATTRASGATPAAATPSCGLPATRPARNVPYPTQSSRTVPPATTSRPPVTRSSRAGTRLVSAPVPTTATFTPAPRLNSQARPTPRKPCAQGVSADFLADFAVHGRPSARVALMPGSEGLSPSPGAALAGAAAVGVRSRAARTAGPSARDTGDLEDRMGRS
nr:hypothetical protein [Streptomyces griseus]